MLWITSQKRVCCYRIWYNTSLNAALLVQKRKPETRGFCGLPKPGFGFGKMSGFPGAPGFSKPGFQSLVLIEVHGSLVILKMFQMVRCGGEVQFTPPVKTVRVRYS